MGSGDDTSHVTVTDGRNLFLFEQRHKLILLAWVGACRASANNRGGQHHRGANQNVYKAGDAGAHGRISISSVSSARYLIQPERRQDVHRRGRISPPSGASVVNGG